MIPPDEPQQRHPLAVGTRMPDPRRLTVSWGAALPDRPDEPTVTR